jgi:amidohydrolase
VLEAKPTPGAEDFGFFIRERRGAFYFIGCRPPDRADVQHHAANFRIDERALLVAYSAMLKVVELYASED